MQFAMSEFGSPGKSLWSWIAPVLLAGTALGCDAVLPSVGADRVLIAALDEPTHLATAALVLTAALDGSRSLVPARWIAVALAASVLIDLDHVPLYLGATGFAPEGRPLTHSLATAVALMAITALLRGRARTVAAATALGVGLHLARDLATGPGVSLCWPLSTRSLVLPYPWYAAVVVALAGIGVARRTLGRASPAGSASARRIAPSDGGTQDSSS